MRCHHHQTHLNTRYSTLGMPIHTSSTFENGVSLARGTLHMYPYILPLQDYTTTPSASSIVFILGRGGPRLTRSACTELLRV